MFHNHLAVDAALSLFPFGSDGFCRVRADIWRSAFSAAASERRSFIFTFNPEASVAPGLITELQALIEASAGRLHYVELVCSETEVLKRLGNDSRRKFGKLTDPELYRSAKLQGGFDFPALPVTLRVDTEHQSAEQSAAVIASALGNRTAP